jgi:hypothetical protein
MAVRIVSKMQDELLRLLPWLTHAFGIAQRMTGRRDEGRTFVYPAAYIGAGEYTNLLPTDALGNYTFVTIDDPQRVAFRRLQRSTVRAPFSLTLWYDLRTVTDRAEERATEEVKRQLLRALSTMNLADGAHVDFTSIYERPSNVWEGYTISEAEAQFMTHPYGALRIEGELTYTEDC